MKKTSVKTVGILTSGGDAPGLNAAIRGICRSAMINYGMKIVGIRNGYRGLVNGDCISIGSDDLAGLLTQGGTILGTARDKPFKNPVPNPETGLLPIEAIKKNYKKWKLDALCVLGGNGTNTTGNLLYEEGLNVIGLPKTIDNDLKYTDHTPGFGSAAKYVATSLLEVIYDSRIYKVKSVTIVEIMGRNAGWLTAAAGLVRGEDCEGVDLIFLPEKVFDVNFFMKRVKEVVAEKKYCVVALSEGVRIADGRFVCELSADDAAVDAFGHKMMSGSAKYLETLVKNEMGIKARAIEISTLQRCASHFASLTDIEEAFDCGAAAVRAAVIDNETGKVVCMNRISAVPYKITYDLADVHNIANVEKTVPLEWITFDYVTEEAVSYIRPLIQGELNPIINDGLPRQIKL